MRVAPALIATGAILVCAACSSDSDKVTIPSSDPTPPTVTMDVFLPNTSTPLTVSPTTPGTPAVTASANDVVTVIARGDDADGGVQDIQIWATQTSWKALPPNLGQQVGPGLAGAPESSNPDASSIGGTAIKFRLTSHNFDIKQLRAGYARVQIDVHATTKNFHGGTATTAVARINWP